MCIDEALHILGNYQLPSQSHVDWKAKSGTAIAATEAPRGLLWHRYEINDKGQVTEAQIVPPTSQNQARIEQNIKLSLESIGLQHSADDLQLHAEKVIRNYDPCISCATHFLKLNVTRQ
jgi:coenzyme F420-reducing hydrogenase alpha subunit